MKQSSRVLRGNGLPKTGHSPNKFLLANEGLSLPMHQIDRGFYNLAEELRISRNEAKRAKAEAAFAKSRSLPRKVSSTISDSIKKAKERLSQSFARKDNTWGNPTYNGFLNGRSPNSPTRGGYKTRKNKKPTILAKKPKKVKKLIKNKAKV
jgi:hypothetical protein